MKLRSLRILILILFVAVISVGCKKATPPVLKDFGPTKTKAGQDFNVQPDGGTAIWVKAENITETTTIVWGDRRVPTFKAANVSDLLTASIPKELYAKPGQYQIYLLDTKTGAKSNSMVFIVEKPNELKSTIAPLHKSLPQQFGRKHFNFLNR